MGFTYYSPVTVNNGQVPRPQSEFPMLVSYTDARFKSTGNGGHVGNTNGYDIRPYLDVGLTIPLKYELVRYSASGGEVIMWVKCPYIFDGHVVYIAYGDSSLSSNGSSTATWSNNYMAVYHLKDGTTLSLADSSSNALNGSNNGATATTGQIDGAASFVSSSSQYATVDPMGLAASTGTVSAWVNATSFPNAYNCVWGGTSVGAIPTALLVKSNGKLAPFFAFGSAQGYDGTGSNTLSASTWYYLAMTANFNLVRGYVNGASDGTSSAINQNWSTVGSADIGQDIVTAGRFWNGVINELKISTVARSGDWLTTEYNNQFAPSTFATLGTEVSPVNFPGLYKI